LKENEKDADNRIVPSLGAKNLGDSSTRTQGSLTADPNAGKKLGGPESNPNANDVGSSGNGVQRAHRTDASQTVPIAGASPTVRRSSPTAHGPSEVDASQTVTVAGGPPRQSGTSGSHTVSLTDESRIATVAGVPPRQSGTGEMGTVPGPSITDASPTVPRSSPTAHGPSGIDASQTVTVAGGSPSQSGTGAMGAVPGSSITGASQTVPVAGGARRPSETSGSQTVLRSSQPAHGQTRGDETHTIPTVTTHRGRSSRTGELQETNPTVTRASVAIVGSESSASRTRMSQTALEAGGSQTTSGAGGSQTASVRDESQTAPGAGGFQTTSGAGGSQTASSQRGAPVGETALTLYRGLPIVAPTTQRGQEIAARITTTPADESLLARIGPLIVGGPEFLNDPFTSSAVSLILAAGDDTTGVMYSEGIARLNSLGQIHAMRGLLGPEANVSNLELYNVLKSPRASGGISDLISGGDVSVYLTTAATAAGGGSPPPNIMQVLKTFRAHSVESIVDQVMGVTPGNQAERTRVSQACATATETLPMYYLERPIGVRECLVTQGITLGRDHEEMIVGTPFALTPQVTALSYSNSAIRLRQYQSAIIRGLLDKVIELTDSSVTNANRLERIALYKGVIEQDDTLVKKLITLAYIPQRELSVVKEAILMILPLDTIGAVPLAVAEDEIPPEP